MFFFWKKTILWTSLILIKSNPAAASYLELEGKIIGKKFPEIYPMLDGYGIEKILINVIKTGKPHRKRRIPVFFS